MGYRVFDSAPCLSLLCPSRIVSNICGRAGSSSDVRLVVSDGGSMVTGHHLQLCDVGSTRFRIFHQF